MANNTKERIEAIEKELLIMEFKNHWTPEDWAKRAKLNVELAKLKNN